MILLIRSKSFSRIHLNHHLATAASLWRKTSREDQTLLLLLPALLLLGATSANIYIYNSDSDSHHENNNDNCWWFRNPAAYWTIHYDLYPPHPLVRRCRISVLPLVCFGANFFLTNVKWAAWSLYPDLILFRLEVMRSQVGAVSWVCWMVWWPRVQVMVVDFNQERMKVKRAVIFGLRMMK